MQRILVGIYRFTRTYTGTLVEELNFWYAAFLLSGRWQSGSHILDLFHSYFILLGFTMSAVVVSRRDIPLAARPADSL